MADKKISQLSAATTPLAGTEVLPIVQSGSTVKVSVDNLTTGKAVTVGSLSSSGAVSGTALTATGNVNFDGGSFVFNDSGADKDFRIEGDTDANLFFTDASADAVGVGTNAPTSGYKLDVRGRGKYALTSGSYVCDFVGSESNATSVQIYADNSTSAIVTGGTVAKQFGIYVNAAERLNIGTGGDVKVNTGNLVVGTAAKGIDFSANTHAAGMTSELLNWYEEGTWTPNQGAGLIVTGAFSSSGTYTRIGRQVTVCFAMSGATSIEIVAGGNITTNLPFTSGVLAAGSLYRYAALGSAVLVDSGTTIVISSEAIPAGGSLTMTITYFV